MILLLLIGCRADEVKFGGDSGPEVPAGSAPAGTRPVVDVAVSTLVGERGYDAAARVVGPIDVDGDGLLDLVVGAPGNDEGGNDRRKTYVFRGPVGAPAEAANADITILGSRGYADAGVPSFADVDGDATGDLYLGGNDEIAVFLAPLAGNMAAEDSDLRIMESLSSVAFGDLDGDEVPDMVLRNWLVGVDSLFLVAGPLESMLHPTDQSFATIVNSTNGLPFGSSLATGGDLDGDGSNDLVLGSDRRLSLVPGPVAAGEHEHDAWSWTETDVSTMAIVGDIDGDGHDDLLVGDTNNGDNDNDAGRVTLLAGPLPDGEWERAELASAVFLGEGISEQAGAAVAPAGDVDGDG